MQFFFVRPYSYTYLRIYGRLTKRFSEMADRSDETSRDCTQSCTRVVIRMMSDDLRSWKSSELGPRAVSRFYVLGLTGLNVYVIQGRLLTIWIVFYRGQGAIVRRQRVSVIITSSWHLSNQRFLNFCRTRTPLTDFLSNTFFVLRNISCYHNQYKKQIHFQIYPTVAFNALVSRTLCVQAETIDRDAADRGLRTAVLNYKSKSLTSLEVWNTFN